MSLKLYVDEKKPKDSVWNHLSGENKFSLALVVIAFLGQLVVICGKYFGFVEFSEQLGGFAGEFVTLFMLYFGGSTLKSAIDKSNAAKKKDGGSDDA